MDKCISGKRVYQNREFAVEALIDTWTRFEYAPGSGPVTVYQCEDCGYYHLTSKGKMDEKLEALLASGKIRLQKEANRWSEKFKKR